MTVMTGLTLLLLHELIREWGFIRKGTQSLAEFVANPDAILFAISYMEGKTRYFGTPHQNCTDNHHVFRYSVIFVIADFAWFVACLPE